MTTQEFSIEFDILYNNLASNAAPPLNEYEKSVFLTKAQSDIVLELYSGRNNLGLAFESSEEVREYLSKLTKSAAWGLVEGNQSGQYWVQDTSTIPSNILAIVREFLWDDDNETILGPVVPAASDEIAYLQQNPFRGFRNTRRAFRVDDGSDFFTIWTSIPIHDTDTTMYRIVYISTPEPIILDEIEDTDLTIDGVSVSKAVECKLPSQLHRMILDRAVLYAKQAYVGGQAQRAQQE